MQTARLGGSQQTFLLGMTAPKSLSKAEALSERSWELNAVIARMEVIPEMMKRKTVSRLQTDHIQSGRVASFGSSPSKRHMGVMPFLSFLRGSSSCSNGI